MTFTTIYKLAIGIQHNANTISYVKICTILFSSWQFLSLMSHFGLFPQSTLFGQSHCTFDGRYNNCIPFPNKKKKCYNNFQVEKCTVHQIPQWIRNCFTIFSNQIYVVLTLLVYLKYGFLKKSLNHECTFDLCQLASHHFLASLLLHPPKSDDWKLSTDKSAFIIKWLM